MLIAQISDFHIVEPGRKACGIVLASDGLGRLVNCLNQLVPQPDVVLITGDLTHDGRAAQVAEAQRLLARLEMPYYIVPGNHDDRATLRSGFSHPSCPSHDDEFLHYTIQGYEIRLIGLDSTSPGTKGGSFCNRRAAWLEARMKEQPNKPTILFLHHPPAKFRVSETDHDGFIGADLLGAIVRKFPSIEGVYCGHIHLNAVTAWCGTIVNAAPSGTGIELALDLTLGNPSGFHLVNPAFLLHARTTDGAIVTHRIEVRQNVLTHQF